MKTIHVVGAVIVDQDRILCAQRGPNGSLALKWEFPGGKVEPGEAPHEALEREITEELRCTVSVGPEITTTRHDYDFATIVLTTFFCSLVSGSPQLTEHADVKWLLPNEMRTLDWAPADIPAVDLIVDGGVP